ncbi:uncharacterized protein [Ptychodera flava]|uniref:uncharacterized protein n=1 Tax=Ptychodera flava TaxID=63121 RepID=UPI00396A2FAB
MDSLIGACWRCGRAGTVKCPQCDFGLYCRRKCMKEDKFRHEVECKYAKKLHACSACGKETSSAKLCSACLSARYCNKDCQKKHWPKHKDACVEVGNNIITLASALVHSQRHVDVDTKELDGLGIYYLGNTPAVDLLKLHQNEWSSGHYPDKLSLLLAGVGDLRNVIKTVASLPDKFKGQVELTMNDCDVHILARNVLFLYMMFSARDIKEVSDALVQLWYSICITDEHNEYLKGVLGHLITTDTDAIAVQTKGKLVVMEDDLEQFKSIWSAWMTSLQSGGPKGHIIEQRNVSTVVDPKCSTGRRIYINSVPRRHLQSLQEYLKCGLLLPSSDPKKQEAVFQNVTLLCINPLRDNSVKPIPFSELSLIGMVAQQFREELLVYPVESDKLPFTCWDYLEASLYTDVNCVPKMYCSYISHLIEKFIGVADRGQTSFHVLLGDCFQLGPTIEGKSFDRIATSNLADYYGVPAILDYFKPFLNSLNPHSLIITESMNWLRHLKAVEPDPVDKKFNFDMMAGIARDTGNPIENLGYLGSPTTFREYCDDRTMFMNYLRIDLLASRIRKSGRKPTRKDIPNYSDATTYNGFRLRDFNHELNRVMPYRWKVNKRRVTQLTGQERGLEWYLTKD